jgi:protein phosphatase
MLGDTSTFQGLRSRASSEGVPAAITDVGCERNINEDRYAAIDSQIGKLWAVCDGMGGTLGGELAAQLAIDAIRRGLEAHDYDSPVDALRGAVEEANRTIVLRRQNPAFSGMGTTVVAALIGREQVVVASAGDSRAYLVRDGAIQQLTTDHSYVQDLVDRGLISEEDALTHPQAHVLTKCLGAEPRLEIDTNQFWIWDAGDAESGDRLVLCTDGLYSLVTDEEIATQVSRLAPQESCAYLVELAKTRGGYDNITLVILPIAGQLREDSPGPAKKPKVDRKRSAAASPRSQVLSPKVPLTKRLVIAFALAVLGALSTAAITLFRLRGG